MNLDIVREEVGNHALSRYFRIVAWLRDRHMSRERQAQIERQVEERNWDLADVFGGEYPNFRFGASLGARSEADLLAMSRPRFCIRVSGGGSGGVWNLRRVQTLSLSAKEIDPNPPVQFAVEFFGGTQTRERLPQDLDISDFLSKFDSSSCVADSLVCVPAWLGNEYSFARTWVAPAYDEDLACDYVPFINHISVGGGLCAQACCLMALMFQERHANALFGIPEITAFSRQAAARFSERQSFDLDGMTSHEIERFFKQSGSGLRSQVELSLARGEDGLADVWLCFRSYTKSNVPVILSVDLGAMLEECPGTPGESLFSANGFENLPGRPGQNTNHAVVVFGTSGRTEKTLLVNDPATYPFLQVPLDDVLRIRRKRQETGSQPTLRPLEAHPVVPNRVVMPLLNRGVDSDETRYGLLAVARSTQVRATTPLHANGHVVPRTDPERFNRSSFRLVRVENYEQVRRSLSDFLTEEEKAYVAQEVASVVGPQWCWIQCFEDISGQKQCVVWSAENEPAACLTPANTTRHIMLVLRVKGRPPRANEHRGGQQGESLNSAVSSLADSRLVGGVASPSLTPCVISSFSPLEESLSASGALAAIRDFNNDRPLHLKAGVDYYAFMQGDIAKWRACDQRSRDSPVNNAIDLLSELAEDDGLLKSVARSLHAASAGSEVRAITTFIPEMPHDPSSKAGKRSADALSGALKLADRMQRSHRHRTWVVEVVSGSRVLGLLERKPKRGDKRYVAAVESRERAVANFLKNVASSLHKTERIDKRIKIAVELEPGPFYTVNDRQGLEELERAIVDADSRVQARLGFNLDVSHWQIAGIADPTTFFGANPQIASRIVHSHVSGHHGAGHFGDRVLDQKAVESLLPWLRFLRSLRERGSRADDPSTFFGGCVSLEYEACGSPARLSESLAALVSAVRSV